MKNKLSLNLIFIVVLASCNSQPVKDDQSKSEANTALQKENDSLQNLLSPNDNLDTPKPKSTETEVTKSPTKKAGKHPITLQWISWDEPGEVTIKPLEDDWYSIGGSQKNKYGDELKIEGKIRRLSEKKLEFEGVIITKTRANNNGEPCIKNGKQLFYAKGNRKYFRLQNMTNCEEGMLVDYVDIYAGTSSL